MFLLILIAAGLSACSATSLPDALILQNERYPQYARYLQGNDYITYNIREGRYQSRKAYNILHLQVYSSDTSRISRSLKYDGMITLKGKDKKNTYVRITDNFTLQPGSYTIYDGHVSDGENICMFVNGYDENGNSKRIAGLPDNGTFEVTENTYCYYRIYIYVKGGYKCNCTVLPMLCNNADMKHYYSPIFSISYFNPIQVSGGNLEQFIVFNITKEELASISYRDFQVFMNNLRYIYARRYISCTLAFEDGTGIQFEDCDPDKGIYGDIDGWYRVNSIEGIIADKDSYLSLVDEDGNLLNFGQEIYGINGIGEE